MTKHLNDYFEASVGIAQPSSKHGYVADAEIIRRDTGEVVATVRGSGRSRNSARTHAMKCAAREFGSKGRPTDWQDQQSSNKTRGELQNGPRGRAPF
jgi:hypothetical protein